MRKSSLRRTLCGLALALAATVLSSYVARAVPYASAITNNSGTIQFILNENADNVGLAFDNGTATNNLGALNKGPNSFSLGVHTNFSIYVYKAGSGIPSFTSVDTNRWVNFWGPRGLTVNRNPKTYNFGRVYVVNASPGTQPLGGVSADNGTRTLTRGVYAINADQTNALGQGDNALTFGMTLAASTTYSPYRISVGEDDMVYVADAAGLYVGGAVTNGVWMVQPDLSSGTNLFPLFSDPQVAGGVEGTPVALGSYAAGNLVLYALSWDLSPYQSVWRYDINGGPLPYTAAPTPICNAGISSVQGVLADMAIGPDGKIYTTEPRSTPSAGNIIIHVFDSEGTLLWDSWNDWGAVNGDPYASSGGIAISSDGKMMATVNRGTGNFAITTLTNGIPDPSTFTLTTTGLGGTAVGIAFDAANNVYLAPSSLAIMRVYSLGMTATAITSNDSTGTNGTFQMVFPSTTVSVAATTDTTSMDLNQPPGVFTLTRSGNTGPALPVGYTLTGTATNGVQYQLLSGKVTFGAGETTTNLSVTAIPYSPAGPTRSVILSINASNNYSPAAPSTATVWIVDTNKPALHIAVRDAQFYERTNDLARFTLTRWGDTNTYLPQINVTYAGTATEGTQFYGQATATMNYGDINMDVDAYPIYDGVLTGPLTVTATVAPATFNDYDVGSPATSGPTTRVDSDDPPETVLWSDNLQTNTSAQWTEAFAAAPDPTDDETVYWAYDYYGNQLIPPAPHSGSDTHGLYMTVNKNDTIAAAAALNFYPKGKSFSGNYAFRFDMFLIENTTSGTTEYALFGINHDGAHTNWFRNSTDHLCGR